MRIIAIDPGESIGVVCASNKAYYGTTITGEGRLKLLYDFLKKLEPNYLVYEGFALRSNAALKLIGSKFITCEVVGVIKLYSQLTNTPCIELPPMSKEFCGFSSNPKDNAYKSIIMMDNEKITEHTRDAFRLLKYAQLFKIKKEEQ